MSRRCLLFVSSAFAVVALLMCIQSSHAIDDDAETNAGISPVLVELKERISELVEKSHPEAKIYFRGNYLFCEYETMAFLVYGRGKDGVYSHNPTSTVGPNRNGFLIRLNVQEFDDGLGTQAGGLVLGVRKGVYWSDYVNHYRIPETNQVIHLQLSFGTTSPEARKFFNEFRKVLANTGKPSRTVTKKPEFPKDENELERFAERRQEWNLFRDVAEQ